MTNGENLILLYLHNHDNNGAFTPYLTSEDWNDHPILSRAVSVPIICLDMNTGLPRHQIFQKRETQSTKWFLRSQKTDADGPEPTSPDI